MNDKNLSIDGIYKMQKFPGKGGWTYVSIPEIIQNKNNPFGWVTVMGSIDGYKLKNHKLMPMGNDKLFLPVKSKIRKIIGKEAGDEVRIILRIDNSPLEIPKEILACFKEEAADIYEAFSRFKDGEKKAYLDWIYSAGKEETKVGRIAIMMSRLSRNLKMSNSNDL